MIGTIFTTTESKKTYVVIEAHHMFEGTWKCYPADKEPPYKPNLIDCFSIEFINKCIKKLDKTVKKLDQYNASIESDCHEPPQSNRRQLLITNYTRPKRTVLKKPVLAVDADTLRTMNLDDGKINYCNLNGNEYRNRTFIELLKQLYNIVGIGMVIYKTTLNLSRTKIDEPGFIYFTDLKLCIQEANNNDIISEIIHIASISRFTLKIKIVLKNRKVVLFRM